jgi:hypothetical protein
VAVLVFGSLIGVGFFRTQDIIDQQSTLLAEQAVTRIEGCRLTNSTNEATRQAFADTFNAINDLGVDPSSVDRLRQALRPPAETDRDCNGDGTLGPDDYALPP